MPLDRERHASFFLFICHKKTFHSVRVSSLNYPDYNLDGKVKRPVNCASQMDQCFANFSGIVEETLKVFTGIVPCVSNAVMLTVHF